MPNGGRGTGGFRFVNRDWGTKQREPVRKEGKIDEFALVFRLFVPLHEGKRRRSVLECSFSEISVACVSRFSLHISPPSPLPSPQMLCFQLFVAIRLAILGEGFGACLHPFLLCKCFVFSELCENG